MKQKDKNESYNVFNIIENIANSNQSVSASLNDILITNQSIEKNLNIGFVDLTKSIYSSKNSINRTLKKLNINNVQPPTPEYSVINNPGTVVEYLNVKKVYNYFDTIISILKSFKNYSTFNSRNNFIQPVDGTKLFIYLDDITKLLGKYGNNPKDISNGTVVINPSYENKLFEYINSIIKLLALIAISAKKGSKLDVHNIEEMVKSLDPKKIELITAGLKTIGLSVYELSTSLSDLANNLQIVLKRLLFFAIFVSSPLFKIALGGLNALKDVLTKFFEKSKDAATKAVSKAASRVAFAAIIIMIPFIVNAIIKINEVKDWKSPFIFIGWFTALCVMIRLVTTKIVKSKESIEPIIKIGDMIRLLIASLVLTIKIDWKSASAIVVFILAITFAQTFAAIAMNKYGKTEGTNMAGDKKQMGPLAAIGFGIALLVVSLAMTIKIKWASTWQIIIFIVAMAGVLALINLTDKKSGDKFSNSLLNIKVGGGKGGGLFGLAMGLAILTLVLLAVGLIPWNLSWLLIGFVFAISAALSLPGLFSRGGSNTSGMFGFAMGITILLLCVEAIKEVDWKSAIILIVFIFAISVALSGGAGLLALLSGMGGGGKKFKGVFNSNGASIKTSDTRTSALKFAIAIVILLLCVHACKAVDFKPGWNLVLFTVAMSAAFLLASGEIGFGKGFEKGKIGRYFKIGGYNGKKGSLKRIAILASFITIMSAALWVLDKYVNNNPETLMNKTLCLAIVSAIGILAMKIVSGEISISLTGTKLAKYIKLGRGVVTKNVIKRLSYMTLVLAIGSGAVWLLANSKSDNTIMEKGITLCIVLGIGILASKIVGGELQMNLGNFFIENKTRNNANNVANTLITMTAILAIGIGAVYLLSLIEPDDKLFSKGLAVLLLIGIGIAAATAVGLLSGTGLIGPKTEIAMLSISAVLLIASASVSLLATSVTDPKKALESVGIMGLALTEIIVIASAIGAMCLFPVTAALLALGIPVLGAISAVTLLTATAFGVMMISNPSIDIVKNFGKCLENLTETFKKIGKSGVWKMSKATLALRPMINIAKDYAIVLQEMSKIKIDPGMLTKFNETFITFIDEFGKTIKKGSVNFESHKKDFEAMKPIMDTYKMYVDVLIQMSNGKVAVWGTKNGEAVIVRYDPIDWNTITDPTTGVAPTVEKVITTMISAFNSIDYIERKNKKRISKISEAFKSMSSIFQPVNDFAEKASTFSDTKKIELAMVNFKWSFYQLKGLLTSLGNYDIGQITSYKNIAVIYKDSIISLSECIKTSNANSQNINQKNTKLIVDFVKRMSEPVDYKANSSIYQLQKINDIVKAFGESFSKSSPYMARLEKDVNRLVKTINSLNLKKALVLKDTFESFAKTKFDNEQKNNIDRIIKMIDKVKELQTIMNNDQKEGNKSMKKVADNTGSTNNILVDNGKNGSKHHSEQEKILTELSTNMKQMGESIESSGAQPVFIMGQAGKPISVKITK